MEVPSVLPRIRSHSNHLGQKGEVVASIILNGEMVSQNVFATFLVTFDILTIEPFASTVESRI